MNKQVSNAKTLGLGGVTVELGSPTTMNTMRCQLFWQPLACGPRFRWRVLVEFPSIVRPHLSLSGDLPHDCLCTVARSLVLVTFLVFVCPDGLAVSDQVLQLGPFCSLDDL